MAMWRDNNGGSTKVIGAVVPVLTRKIYTYEYSVPGSQALIIELIPSSLSLDICFRPHLNALHSALLRIQYDNCLLSPAR